MSFLIENFVCVHLCSEGRGEGTSAANIVHIFFCKFIVKDSIIFTENESV